MNYSNKAWEELPFNGYRLIIMEPPVIFLLWYELSNIYYYPLRWGLVAALIVSVLLLRQANSRHWLFSYVDFLYTFCIPVNDVYDMTDKVKVT